MVADGLVVGFVEADSGSVDYDTYSTFWTNHTSFTVLRIYFSPLNEPTFIHAVGELGESEIVEWGSLN